MRRGSGRARALTDYLSGRWERRSGGGLRLRSGEQRFYDGTVAFDFPMAASGLADVHEYWDEAEQRFRICVSVANPRFGPLFGYAGWFEVEERPIAGDAVPADVRPRREERRE